MNLILKKLGKKQFVWDQNAFQKRGGWYETLKGGGYGRSATAKERSQLGIPTENEAPEDRQHDEDEQEDDHGAAGSYRHAANIRYTGLRGLVTANLLRGHDLKDSVKSSVSDTLKAHVTGLKEKFDPLNIAKSLTGNLGATILGLATKRSDEDLNYFTGQRRRRRITSASSIGANVGGGNKVGTVDTAMYTSVPEGKQQRFRKGDGAADLLSRLLNLMKKYHEEDIHQLKIDRHLDKERKLEKDKWNKEVLAQVGGKSFTPVGAGGTGGGGPSLLAELAEDYILYKILGRTAKLGGRVGSLGSKLVLKGLLKTKMGRDLVKSSIRAARPVANAAKSAAGFFKPAGAVATAGAAATASAISKTVPKPGFLMTAEEKIAQNKAAQAASSAAPKAAGVVAKEAEKSGAKLGAKGFGTAMKGLGIIGKKIPGLGLLVGAGLGLERALSGDIAGGGLELLSGALGASMLGIAGSLAIDAYLIKRDEDKENMPDRQNFTPAAPAVKPVDKITPTDSASLIPKKVEMDASKPGFDFKKASANVMGVSSPLTPVDKTTPVIPKSTIPDVVSPKNVATPLPAAANPIAKRAQDAITTNQSEKVNNSTSDLSKSVTFNNPKTVVNKRTAPETVSYNETFNCREMDSTLFWVLETNCRRV